MIPDFPFTKSELMEVFAYQVSIRHKRYLGPFPEIPSYQHHEGDTWELVRQDGTSSDDSYKDISSQFEIHVDEVPQMTVSDLIGRIDTIARETAQQTHRMILQDIHEAAEEAGQVTDAKGEPFDQDLFLEGLRSVQIDFDKEGNPKEPALVMAPELWETKKEEFMAWEEDEDFKRRYAALMQEKREEWRARESRRKLVD